MVTTMLSEGVAGDYLPPTHEATITWRTPDSTIPTTRIASWRCGCRSFYPNRHIDAAPRPDQPAALLILNWNQEWSQAGTAW